MRELLNDWVGYIDRTYIQIKEGLLFRLGVRVPELSDHSEGNPLVLIISMFSGMAEMINYYIDNMAREAFIETATLYESVIRLSRHLDYRIQARIPATVDLVFSFIDSITNQPVTVPQNWFIPSGIAVTDGRYTFLVTEDAFMLAGTNNVTLFAKQVSYATRVDVGVSSGARGQRFSLGESYVDSTAEVEINNELWELVDSLGRSNPTDRHFIVDIETDGLAYLKFGNGVFGAIPPAGAIIFASFFRSDGPVGVEIGANTLDSIQVIPSNLAHPLGQTLTPASYRVFNPIAPSGGTDYEGINSIRYNAPRSFRSLETAITRRDFEDLLALAPGVGQGAVEFCCDENGLVRLYVAPSGGGIASAALLKDVERYFDRRKAINTFVDAVPTGITQVYIQLTVTAKFGTNLLDFKTQIEDELVDWGSFTNSSINRQISKSDIIFVVGNLPRTQRVVVDKLFTAPYARPLFEGSNPLIAEILTLPQAQERIQWRVEFVSNQFRVFRNGVLLAQISEDEQFVDITRASDQQEISLVIDAGIYSEGMAWEFTTYPYNSDLLFEDFTVPVISRVNLVVNVVFPTPVTNNC